MTILELSQLPDNSEIWFYRLGFSYKTFRCTSKYVVSKCLKKQSANEIIEIVDPNTEKVIEKFYIAYREYLDRRCNCFLTREEAVEDWNAKVENELDKLRYMYEKSKASLNKQKLV